MGTILIISIIITIVVVNVIKKKCKFEEQGLSTNSHYNLPKRYLTIDIETADGFKEICSISIVIVQDYNIIFNKNWLIKPNENYYNPRNIAIHGITPNMTKDCPTFSEVWPEILPYLDYATVFAHNAKFDIPTIKEEVVLNGLVHPKEMKYGCTLIESRSCLSLDNYRLPTVSEAIGYKLNRHHDATQDAIACAHIVGVLNRIKEKYNLGFSLFNYNDIIVDDDIVEIRRISRSTSTFFKGKSVCISGDILSFSRDEIQLLIAKIGGIPKNNVIKNLDYLVLGDNHGEGKITKARLYNETGKSNIKIISSKEFIEKL